MSNYFQEIAVNDFSVAFTFCRDYSASSSSLWYLNFKVKGDFIFNIVKTVGHFNVSYAI